MSLDPAQLDELGRIFARRAVDALLASESETAPPAANRRGREAQSHYQHDKPTLPTGKENPMSE
jgi:hypothetical protein